MEVTAMSALTKDLSFHGELIPTQVDDLPRALRRAQRFTSGCIATMPELLRYGVNDWYAANSGLYFGRTTMGNDVAIVAHGVGPFTDPERIEGARKSGMINGRGGMCVGRISDAELEVLLGSATPSFSYDEVRKAAVLPRNYAVVMGRDAALRASESTMLPDAPHSIDSLRSNPLFVACAGNQEMADEAIGGMVQRDGSSLQHGLRLADVTLPHGGVLFLGFYSKPDSIESSLSYNARFAVFAHEAQGNARAVPGFDEIMAVVGPYIAPGKRVGAAASLQELYR
jgi:hypothetical protein